MKHLNLLIKPASGLCNMRCKYCFYYDITKHRKESSYGVMNLETLEQLVKQAYKNDHETVTFMFQGGEPTLATLKYYENLIQLVSKYNTLNTLTEYTIQTNGINITPAYAKFFKQHNFLVGISIDGNERVHNTFRLDQKHESTFKQVKKGLQLLKQHNVNYNILTVITDETVNHTEQVYRYLTTLGTNYLQFIPCIDSFDNQVEDYTLDVMKYNDFLNRLYNVWETDFYKGKRISIRYFDDLFKIILGFQPASCTLHGQCMTHLVVEADGSVYPCDFYVLDEYQTGSIFKNTFEEISSNKSAVEFIETSKGTHPDCKTCSYYQLCKGGCRRNKEPFEKVSNKKTKYCAAYFDFFEKNLGRMIKVANVIRKELMNGTYNK